MRIGQVREEGGWRPSNQLAGNCSGRGNVKYNRKDEKNQDFMTHYKKRKRKGINQITRKFKFWIY